MACCKCCCGNRECDEGDEGKCCCGGANGSCCQEGQYCCDGECSNVECGPVVQCACTPNCVIITPAQEGNQYQGTFGSDFFDGSKLESPVQFTWKPGYPAKLAGCNYGWIYTYRQTIGMDPVFVDGCPAVLATVVPGKGVRPVIQIGRTRYKYRLLLCRNDELIDITGDAVNACESSQNPPEDGPPNTRNLVNAPCLSGEYCWIVDPQSYLLFNCNEDVLFKQSTCNQTIVVSESSRPVSPVGDLDILPTLNCGNP